MYKDYILTILRNFKLALTDLIPVTVVIVCVQVVVIGQALAQIGEVVFGLLGVVVGWMAFLDGLVTAPVAMGQTRPNAAAPKGRLL